MRELAEQEGFVLQRVVKRGSGSGCNGAEPVAKDAVLDSTDAQTGSDRKAGITATSAHSKQSFSSHKTVEKPSIEPETAFSATTSGVGAVARGASSDSGAGRASRDSAAASSGANNDSFTAHSSSNTEREDPADSMKAKTTAPSREVTTTLTTITASPIVQRPEDGGLSGSATVWIFLIVFIVALAMYGGRLCPRGCPFFGHNRGGPDGRARSSMEPQQHPLYSRLPGRDNRNRVVEPAYATAGDPFGGHKLGYLPPPTRGSVGNHSLFVEMENKPIKAMRSPGVCFGGGKTDPSSPAVTDNAVEMSDFFGDSGSSTSLVAMQASQPSTSSVKSLRKNKLTHAPAPPMSSLAFGTAVSPLGSNTGSVHNRSTACPQSIDAASGRASQATGAPRPESAWKW
ncbi:hypothetical protein LSCM1_02793 [Leishmania martiniquensis]|uniref:Uncharacterized protein n=1 Tax=Leishmania martiniquensis TaxID=1580590 RepID=A0A836KKZ6_9TRYP|nr:hypothetical protein LSCM1_02793 [Leishmania martiniquensis]